MTTPDDEINDGNRVEIPYQNLPPETLSALIEEFVTRDGADWDQSGCTLEDKRKQVMAQLAAGNIRIVHDLCSESTNLLPRS
jgi:uncharacterized protein YheU (UPF0270 family)